MTRGYLRLLPGLRDSASMIGAKSVPALASTYSTPRSARRERKDSAVMRAAVSVTGFPRLAVNVTLLPQHVGQVSRRRNPPAAEYASLSRPSGCGGQGADDGIVSCSGRDAASQTQRRRKPNHK